MEIKPKKNREDLMSINTKSVLLSGLVAGVAIIVSAMAMVPVVGKEMNQVLADRGLPPLSNLAMAYFPMYSLIIGIFLVWLYAVAKTHFGPGKKTALIVSFTVWFLAYFLSNVSKVVYGFMPIRLTVIGTAWGLVELVLAGLIGSHFYREKKK
jgi:hypothetical protein